MGYKLFSFCGILLFLGKGETFPTQDTEYRLLQSGGIFNYYYWDGQCRGLGDGWSPAIISSETELKFIHASLAWGRTRSFWVGGSTSGVGIRGRIAFYEYQQNSTGQRGAYIWTGYHAQSSFFFDLKSLWFGVRLHAILCKTDGLSFHSGVAVYQKLVSSTPQNRAYWTNKCAAIAPGWIPAILNDLEELNFIKANQRNLSNNRSYWIGGTSRATGDIDFFHYRVTDNDNPVFVSTQQDGTYDNENFQMKTGNETLMLHGVLCENDGLLYESSTSYYRKLVNYRTFTYPHWSLRCRELGVGWDAAVADDSSELDFFKQNNRISSDVRNYWIGGLAYDTLPDPRAWYLVRGSNGLTYLHHGSKSISLNGILCELAK